MDTGSGGRRPSGDAGETLIELLISLMILGITVAAIIAGLGTGIVTTTIHRKNTVAGDFLRDYAEKVKGTGYVECATATAYSATALGMSVPAGYTVTASAPKFWDDGPMAFTSACAPDPGLQQVVLGVTSADGQAGESLAVVIRKP